MKPQAEPQPASAAADAQPGCPADLTPSERERLTRLRDAIATCRVDDLDFTRRERRRMEFFRWLARTGRINEGN